MRISLRGLCTRLLGPGRHAFADQGRWSLRLLERWLRYIFRAGAYVGRLTEELLLELVLQLLLVTF